MFKVVLYKVKQGTFEEYVFIGKPETNKIEFYMINNKQLFVINNIKYENILLDCPFFSSFKDGIILSPKNKAIYCPNHYLHIREKKCT